jgi:hypothetical protein
MNRCLKKICYVGRGVQSIFRWGSYCFKRERKGGFNFRPPFFLRPHREAFKFTFSEHILFPPAYVATHFETAILRPR